MQVKTRRSISTVGIVFLVGCASHAARGSVDRTQSCYEGLAYGFIDTLAVPDAPRDHGKMGLILSRTGDAVDGERSARTIVAKDLSSLPGTWAKLNDSVIVKHLTFPTAEWVLREEAGGLRGRLHSASDNIEHDSKGNVIKQRSDWPATLRSVSCNLVPPPSNTR